MQTSTDVRKQIFSRYNQDPQGWKVFVSRDSKGYYNTFFIHGKEAWIIKEHRINPYESIGYGEHTAQDDISPDLLSHPFGFRPVSKRLIENVLTQRSSQDSMFSLTDSILRQKPVPIKRISSPIVIEGPVIHAPSSLKVMPQQEELEENMAKGLNTLLSRRYPHLSSTYG